MKTQLKIYFSFILVFFFTNRIDAQRVLETKRIDQPIELDGLLVENCWKTAPVADSFQINFPRFGDYSKFTSTVQLVYDDQAIYIAATLIDPQPDSILDILSQRDDFGNADWFGVYLDPYGAGQNGFGFFVTAAGVELDAIMNQTDADFSWNSVWKSRVQRTSTGWTLEMRIPLSQLRFPDKDIQTWKINFKRQIRRNRESSYWSPVDPQKYGEITQSGSITNLKQLVSPLRLSFSPYSTAYLENFFNAQSGNQEWRFFPRFGLDVKYGLSEAFTLDATLVPDFGQTVSDNLVLNLSPFEVRYNENRPFFLEGTDLFGIGDIFYSRRIGATALNSFSVSDSLQSAGNEIISAPSLAQLVNATKISGRTKKGLGIGVFNAIEKRSYIVYRDSTGRELQALAHPLSNYNVLVLSQNLKNNANVSIINSNVYRPDIDQIANVTSGQFLVFSKNKKYSFTGNGQLSANSLKGNSILGHTAYGSFARVQGSMNFNVDYYECSNTYDPNELGFLPRNNLRGVYSRIEWTAYKPKGRFLRRSINATNELEYLYTPGKFAYWRLGTFAIGTFKSFLTSGLEFNVFPLGEVDHFESRTFGVPLNFPFSVRLGGFYSSDYSKRYALDFSIYNQLYSHKGMYNLDANISPRVRISNRLFVVLRAGVSRLNNNYGFVRVSDTSYQDQITIGTRNRWIVNNSLSADYTFTNRMGMVMQLNHYWQEVSYSGFSKLLNDGNRVLSSYSGTDSIGNSLHNTSFNAFTIDFNFRWVIFPGSEIRFLWKFNIYASKLGLDGSYFNTFNSLFDQPQLNSFSIRALFFLDAGRLKKRKK